MTERNHILLIAALAVVTTGCSDVWPPGAGSWEFEDGAVPTEAVDDATQVDRWVETEVEDTVCASSDLALEVVSVNGSVRTEGTWVNGRGWSVVYKDQRTNARYVFAVDVGDSDESIGSYRGELPAGTYDFALQTSALEHCTYSCVAARRTVTVGPERRFDFDVDIALVDGDFWLNPGGPGLPLEPTAHLEFRSVDTGTVYSSMVSRGAAGGYQVIAPVGEYDVTWVPDGPAEVGEFAPIGVGYIGRFDLESYEYLSLELNSTTLAGEVLVGGGVMPDDTLLDGEPRALLRFSLRGPHYGTWEVPLGEIGPGTFSQPVFPGDYVIEFVTNDDSRQNVLVPSRSLSLCDGEACRIGAETDPLVVDMERWLNEPLVWVNGQLDLDGSFGADCAAGRVHFTEREPVEAPRMEGATIVESESSSYYPSGWSTRVDDQGRFEIELPRGNYEVSLQRGIWECTDASLGTTVLDTNADIFGSRSSLHYVVESGGVAGELTVNHGAMPDNGLSADLRGELELRHDGGVVFVPLGVTGPARFEQPLLPGTYEAVIITERISRVPVPFVQDVLPNGERTLGTVTVHPGETTVLDLDLNVIQLRDRVQFSGLRDLEGTLDGRALAVLLVESATGLGYEFGMDSSGEFTGPAYPGTYEALLVERDDVWPEVSGPPLGQSLLSSCYVVE